MGNDSRQKRCAGITILRRVFAVDPLQKQPAAVCDTIDDCSSDATSIDFPAVALASMDTLMEQGGNLRQGCSSMLRDLTVARDQEQS